MEGAPFASPLSTGFPASPEERARLAPYFYEEGMQGVDLDALVAREQACLAASGCFDATWYAENNPDVVRAGRDPLEHFCRYGWRQLRDPAPGFGVWWYWASYLDPARECINPLVHFALVGREKGLEAFPPPYRPDGKAQSFPVGRPVRRACLFAGFDADGLVDDCVVDYVRELSRHADVWYLADSVMQPGELDKLTGLVRGAWDIRHGAYDFGSWSRLARDLVGWDTLLEYDEVVLANDSCWLLHDLDAVFRRMDARPCDWWGMQATKGLYRTRHKPENRFRDPIPMEVVKREKLAEYHREYLFDFHVGSYFLAFRQNVLRDEGFRRRLDAVVPQDGKLNTIRKYEIGLGRYLMASGHAFDTFIDHLYPFHPVYSESAFDLIAEGFPFLKRYLLTENHYRVPGLDRWKERVLERVPSAPVERFEKQLLRVADDEKLCRNLHVTRGPAGHAIVPRLLTGEAFRRADAVTPTHDHWWAFPVCAFTHRFTGNERAVFETVKRDPSIKKIVLTRKKRVAVDGENVVVVPLRSSEGQHFLLRARQIFIKHSATRNIVFPVCPDRHNIINLWHGVPLKRIGYASLDMRDKLDQLGEEHRKCRAVIAASRVDAMAMASAFYPLSYNDVWVTGLPRHDFIMRPIETLPEDMQLEDVRLRSLLGGRRLVLFVPTFRNTQENGYYLFKDEELQWLEAWLERHDAVLGVREHMADKAHVYGSQLSAIGAVDLGDQRFPDIEILYRQADLLLTDFSSCFIDFMLTGKPMASFAYDYEQYIHGERGLFYDMEHVFPGPVCRDFQALRHALEHADDLPTAMTDAGYRWKRQLLFDYQDDANAWRVVQHVKALYRNVPTGLVPEHHEALAAGKEV